MSTNLTDSLPPHEFYYHGFMTECGVCGHPAKCVRLDYLDTCDPLDVCPACIKEDAEQIDMRAVVGWCTDCQHTIPDNLKSETIQD